MKISQVHLSLTIQYASDAIGKLADLIDCPDRSNVAILVARTSLERALQSIDEISISTEEE